MKQMDIDEEIDKFLSDYEFEGEEANSFVSLLTRARDEIKNLKTDGISLLQVIADKNHNASVMRKHIADLEKKIKELKK